MAEHYSIVYSRSTIRSKYVDLLSTKTSKNCVSDSVCLGHIDVQ